MLSPTWFIIFQFLLLLLCMRSIEDSCSCSGIMKNIVSMCFIIVARIGTKNNEILNIIMVAVISVRLKVN